MIIFDVDTCPVVLHVLYMLICVNCLWIDILPICYAMLLYVVCMIIIMVQCAQGYVWDRIREGCTKRNVTIEVRYFHETLRLGLHRRENETKDRSHHFITCDCCITPMGSLTEYSRATLLFQVKARHSCTDDGIATRVNAHA